MSERNNKLTVKQIYEREMALVNGIAMRKFHNDFHDLSDDEQCACYIEAHKRVFEAKRKRAANRATPVTKSVTFPKSK